MKTNIKTIMMALMAMLAFSFTSCDDDDYIARTLEGTWEGDMYVSYYFDYYDKYYDASYSEICFLRDPYRYASGDGYNGNIRVYFVEDRSEVVIYNYALNDSYFTGYIDLGDGGRQKFNLRHVSSPNWGSYYWGYDSSYYYDHYYYSNENKVGMEKAKAKNPEAAKASDTPRRIFRARE